jgi:hypothetical protein
MAEILLQEGRFAGAPTRAAGDPPAHFVVEHAGCRLSKTGPGLLDRSVILAEARMAAMAGFALNSHPRRARPRIK